MDSVDVEVVRSAEAWRKAGHRVTLGTIVKTWGSAPRPVGGACGANRIPLVIPCHRVVASHGIGGFMHQRRGAPLEVKRWLLRHEGAKAAAGDA